MMDKIKDLNKSFQAMRLVALVSTGALVVATCFYAYHYDQVVARIQNKIYVVSDKGTFPAVYAAQREVSRFEADHHLRTFITTVFAHDANTYEEHMNLGLHLIDEPSGRRIANDYEKGEIVKKYIRYGVRTEVAIDSVVLHTHTLPMKGRAYFRQHHYQGGDLRHTLAIGIKFNLALTHRHDKNPWGLQITEFDFIPYGG